jgi:hypothetical protein
MSRRQLPVEIVSRESWRHGIYYVAKFKIPQLDWLIGTGASIGEAIADLKSARRDAIRADTHWKYHPDPFGEYGYRYNNWTYRKLIRYSGGQER